MWFKVSRDTLEELINQVVPVIPSRTPYPVIQNLLCTTGKGKLEILATDLDIYVKTSTQIDTDKEERVLLPGRKLAGIVKESAGDEIEFTKEENRVILKAGPSVFRIPLVDPEEFPRMFDRPTQTKFDLDCEDFTDLVGAVDFAVSKGEDRPAMTGILWELKSDKTRMVATDGHRMALSESSQNIPQSPAQSHILPTKIFSFVPKDLKGSIRVFLDDAKIGLSFKSSEVVSRLIEGPYPDYQKVIPQEINNVLVVNREEVAAALRRMLIFTNQVTRQIKFVLGSDKLKLYSTSPEGEEATEEMSCSYKGEAFEVAYNGSYLLDILRHLSAEEVTFEITGALSAALIRDSGERDQSRQLYLLMPILLD